MWRANSDYFDGFPISDNVYYTLNIYNFYTHTSAHAYALASQLLVCSSELCLPLAVTIIRCYFGNYFYDVMVICTDDTHAFYLMYPFIFTHSRHAHTTMYFRFSPLHLVTRRSPLFFRPIITQQWIWIVALIAVTHTRHSHLPLLALRKMASMDLCWPVWIFVNYIVTRKNYFIIYKNLICDLLNHLRDY